MSVDFGKTASDYARHRAGFPDSFFARLIVDGVAASGSVALDLGTGTGTVARGLAQAGLRVTGLDPSDEMLRRARDLDRAADVDVDYIVAAAEETGLPDARFDLVVAGQCWHWFDRDAAAREVRRLLKPGGHLVIAHFDWLPLAGNVVAATEDLIRRHNPSWTMHGGTGIYPAWFTDIRSAGFADVHGWAYDEAAAYSHEAWRGRIRASAGVAASLPPDDVERFDADLARLLARDFAEDPMAVPHCVSAVIGTRG